MKVPALPFTMERPIDCDGFAGETAVFGIQVPETAKHPAVMFTPLTAVVVPAPPKYREPVEVAFPNNALSRVEDALLKFCSVDDESAMSEVRVEAPALRVSPPISMAPNPEVMEPAFKTPTVVSAEVMTPLPNVVPFKTCVPPIM